MPGNKHAEGFDRKGLAAFKNQIVLRAVILAVLCELLSLPFLGWRTDFAYGLALGTGVAIVNFHFLAFTIERMLDEQKSWYSVVGYALRIALYGIVFLVALRFSRVSAAATLLGFLLLKVVIFYLHGLKPKFRKSVAAGKPLNDLDQDQWAREDRNGAGETEQEKGGLLREIFGSAGWGKPPAEPADHRPQSGGRDDPREETAIDSGESPVEWRSKRYKRKTVRKY